jgi:hypothetical protein
VAEGRENNEMDSRPQSTSHVVGRAAGAHRDRARFFVAILVAISAVLTTPIWNLVVDYVRATPSSTGGQRRDGKPILSTLRDIFDDIDSRPLVQQDMTAKQYLGIKVEEESLCLLDVISDDKTKAITLMMAIDGERPGSHMYARTVVCSVSEAAHPKLRGARRGLRLLVSGEIEAAKRGCIQLTNVSLGFAQ